MNLSRLSIFNVDTIGVYAFSNNKYTIVPKSLGENEKRELESTLGTTIIEAEVAGTYLIGVFMAGNDNGILLPKNVLEHEYASLKKLDMNVGILNSRTTAIGNVILANNRAAIVYKDLEREAVNSIKDVLGVEEVIQDTIGGFLTVGSVGVVTQRGGLVHPEVDSEELERLSRLFSVKIEPGTVNFGSSFIRSGLIANDKGIIVGNSTTGPEIVRIQKALGEKNGS